MSTTPSDASQENSSSINVLSGDIDRLTAEVKQLASHAMNLPKDMVFNDLAQSVRKSPLQSVAIAVGVGLAIGIILAR